MPFNKPRHLRSSGTPQRSNPCCQRHPGRVRICPNVSGRNCSLFYHERAQRRPRLNRGIPSSNNGSFPELLVYVRYRWAECELDNYHEYEYVRTSILGQDAVVTDCLFGVRRGRGVLCYWVVHPSLCRPLRSESVDLGRSTVSFVIAVYISRLCHRWGEGCYGLGSF